MRFGGLWFIGPWRPPVFADQGLRNHDFSGQQRLAMASPGLLGWYLKREATALVPLGLG